MVKCALVPTWLLFLRIIKRYSRVPFLVTPAFWWDPILVNIECQLKWRLTILLAYRWCNSGSCIAMLAHRLHVLILIIRTNWCGNKFVWSSVYSMFVYTDRVSAIVHYGFHVWWRQLIDWLCPCPHKLMHRNLIKIRCHRLSVIVFKLLSAYFL